MAHRTIYSCDNCNQEVKDEDELAHIGVRKPYSPEISATPYETEDFELCKDCFGAIPLQDICKDKVRAFK